MAAIRIRETPMITVKIKTAGPMMIVVKTKSDPIMAARRRARKRGPGKFFVSFVRVVLTAASVEDDEQEEDGFTSKCPQNPPPNTAP
jgi:hypothetical protein